MRRLFCWILVTGALAPTASVAAQSETGSIKLRLLEAPSDRRDDPRASSYIIDHLHPGESITRKIGVTNTSEEPVKVSLYAGAAELEEGAFVPAGRGEDNEVASWTSVTPGSIDVPASDEAPGTVNISVPKDASLGERYGVVWAELPKASPRNGGASQVNRVGIRIYLSVGPGGEPASDFVIDSLVARRVEDGTPVVVARVTNTGGRALDMTGTLRLTRGPGGLSAGPFPAELGTTLGIGEEAPVSVALDKALPDGPWDAKISLRSGLVERSASGSITFPERAGSAAPAIQPATPSPAFDTGTVALIVVALAVALLLLLVFLRRRQARKRMIPFVRESL